ncbi:MAG: hypothetical protein ACXWAT_06735 [Methylobacter sp.]
MNKLAFIPALVLIVASALNLANADTLSQDENKVKLAHEGMQKIEDMFIGAQNDFMASAARMVSSKKPSKSKADKMNAEFNSSLAVMNKALDESDNLIFPSLENKDGERYIVDAMDSHKKWALAQRTKLSYIIQADLDNAKIFGNAADEFAAKEAMSLFMAYKAVGLNLD